MAGVPRLYNYLPHTFKVLAASLHGYRLARWRYGAETESLIEEALERDHWAREQWNTWRDERLAYILRRAATDVPYYRKYWANRGGMEPGASWERLENWPILEKDTVRNDPRAFVADSSRNKRLYVDHTGGTTGRPTLIYESRETVMSWYALLEARLRRWYGADHRERWGMFGGQQVISLEQKSPPYWVYNAGLRQLYFSVFHVDSRTAVEYVKELNRFQPEYLVVYPSILAELSRHMLEQGLTPPRLKAVFCNSEKVLANHRAAMQAVFDCPIVDTYGMAELTAAASECEAGVIHEWPDVGYLEVVDPESGESVHTAGTVGDYVMTGLVNEDMPLIRYRNGDAGSLPDADFRCACGRLLPRFGSIQGRANDLIQASDGRRLYILDSLFSGLPVAEGQVVQENPENATVRLVPCPGFSDKDRRVVIARLSGYLGSIQIQVEVVPQIPREPNGKFRPYVSRVGLPVGSDAGVRRQGTL